MRTRPLGKTGLNVSELAVGTWGLSGEPYGPVDAAEAERTLRRALDMGFTLVDTADSYGAGKMERMVGAVVGKRDDVVVVTKGGIDRSHEPPRKNFTKAYLEAAVRRSLTRLGRDHLDVYLLHNPTASTIYAGEVAGVLGEMVKAGTIRFWGVSAGDEHVARAALEHGAQVVELPYNVFHGRDLNRVSGDLMVSGAGVLARSVLNYGMLSGLWPKDREFPETDHRSARWTRLEFERRLEQLDAVRYLVRKDVLTLRGAAVRFALANHLVSSAVLGPRTVAQLEQLVRETGGGPRYLPDDDLRSLPQALERVGIET
ncbi:MAG: aldo/keto reductase [Polyangiaceae bacterium]